MNELVEKKSPAVLAAEIRALTVSMLSTIIEIGRRMCQAKDMSGWPRESRRGTGVGKSS